MKYAAICTADARRFSRSITRQVMAIAACAISLARNFQAGKRDSDRRGSYCRRSANSTAVFQRHPTAAHGADSPKDSSRSIRHHLRHRPVRVRRPDPVLDTTSLVSRARHERMSCEICQSPRKPCRKGRLTCHHRRSLLACWGASSSRRAQLLAGCKIR